MSTYYERSAILVASSKGGSGKTTFARGLIDYLRVQHGIATAAFDADGGTESLLQFYGQRNPLTGALAEEEDRDPVKGVRNFSVRRDRERDTLINLFDELKTPRTVIDLPGGGEEEVAKILGNADRFFEAYENLGVKPIVVIVINSTKSSAGSIPIIMEMFGSRPHFIIAKNPSQGSRFRHFEGYEITESLENGEKRRRQVFGNAKKRVLESGGQIVNVPRLDIDTYEDVDFYSLKWDEAENDKRLAISDRLRVQQWRKDFAHSLVGTALEIKANVRVAGVA